MMELLEEDLTCPICCSLFDDPRVLPCSHNFCKKCLEGILEGNIRSALWRQSNFKCPTCRKETLTIGVSSLQVNYSLKGIVEKYNKFKVLPKMPVCKVHSGQPLNIFCSTDLKLICGFCATQGDHTNHGFCSIEDAYCLEKNAFESLFQSFETWRCGDLLSQLDTLETSKRRALQLLTKDSDKVKEYFDTLEHTLEQKKNEILSDFESMKLAVMQAYDPEINKLNMVLHEQKQALSLAESFRDLSDPIIFLQQMQEFREKIRLIKESPLPAYSGRDMSSVLKSFDTSQWNNVKLRDVEKLSLPQEPLTSKKNIPWWISCRYGAELICLLVTLVIALLVRGPVSDTLSSWISTLISTYAADTARLADSVASYWEEAAEGVQLLGETCRSCVLILLEQVAAFVCKYKLL
ncbi:E3 ubiquitin-protein ligase TRIM13 isoform X2 [Microcaecilia unicolor]|nr:E3 ubiquitin-protein ligase TRIM13 isoform X2 [Microcaecilia unicolor]XP_030056315.1 E3 ubiquitin-protein ligase TRIM13 isoform X2 [Microcaecilia unicolor]XP_030056316.1 E3 ubiquitin-protein ligase TRIM13 isoform X2 [Microcaecilia unicolor]XP_030056317.1 E3 ubiquitin-protein ligase TRIM13 isoform X2 [Microcaecilia unicolor]